MAHRIFKGSNSDFNLILFHVYSGAMLHKSIVGKFGTILTLLSLMPKWRQEVIGWKPNLNSLMSLRSLMAKWRQKLIEWKPN
jgi:hypothetical protein